MYFFHKDNVSVDSKDKVGMVPHDKPLRTYDIRIPIFYRIFLHIAIEVQNNSTFFDCVDINRVERFSCHKEDKDHHDRVPGKYVFHKPISSCMVYHKTNSCQSIVWLQVQIDHKNIWIWLKFRNSNWSNKIFFAIFILTLEQILRFFHFLILASFDTVLKK